MGSTIAESMHSRLITGFVTRLTRRVLLVEQELPTLPEHLSSPPVFSGVRVTRSLVVYVCFVDRCLSFCTFFLVIVLSVLLRFTDSVYPFGIFKLFLHIRQKNIDIKNFVGSSKYILNNLLELSYTLNFSSY